jgi:hypothetical protein
LVISTKRSILFSATMNLVSISRRSKGVGLLTATTFLAAVGDRALVGCVHQGGVII